MAYTLPSMAPAPLTFNLRLVFDHELIAEGRRKFPLRLVDDVCKQVANEILRLQVT